jgi:hypothetical protein
MGGLGRNKEKADNFALPAVHSPGQYTWKQIF